MSFPAHDTQAKFDFPREEEKVLKYWREIDAFQEQLRQSKDRKPFTFYDGPPFATGTPHYGHLLMGTVKDIVTRYASSTGHFVDRRFGWDTHGLPIEYEIDKTLGIKTKEDVLKMGIREYNQHCRAIVMRYSAQWRETVERSGRWIDFDRDYKTLDPTFMESVWWVFKQLWEKGSVYRGLRVMPYSTACTTPLSNFEAGSNYKDVNDPAVVVAFPIVDDPESASFLAWTTTPWTLPSNIALCVNAEFNYLKIWDKERDRLFWLAETRLPILYKDPKKALKDGKYEKRGSAKGNELVGKKYLPPFDFFYEQFKSKAFKVISDPYVKDSDGTGIVHQAPAFGEDDYRIALREGLVREDEMPPCPVDESGLYTAEVGDEYKGLHVKAADPKIIAALKANKSLVNQAVLNHSYPHCWRSGTPLIYKAIPAWFIRVSPVVNRLVKNNQNTRWVPASVGENRFQNWLENARDWNVSRNRYWGTPLPVWVSDDMEEMVCVGSIEELDRLSGCGKISDLHRESVDGITIPSQKGKGQLRRIEEVFDCWFESGSMPYAQSHYPFENEETFKAGFPANFISEAIDQTRGWFYTLLVIGTLLFDTAPWKNLIVCGHILAEDGKKMSKSLRNYVDPNEIMNLHGADAMRVFLVNSPVVRGDSLRFREKGPQEVLARVLLPWVNAFRFFVAQTELLKKESNIDYQYNPHAHNSGKEAWPRNVMDKWILARCQSLIQHVKDEMDVYRLYNVMPRMLTLIDELTNWYIKFNRRRLKGEDGPEDTVDALNCLFETLLTLSRTLSPFTPFLTENLYQGLRPYLAPNVDVGLGEDQRSVHFLPFPTVNQAYFDPVIERQVSRLQAVIVIGRRIRETANLAMKLPLAQLVIFHPDSEYLSDIEHLGTYIKEELNVQELELSKDESLCGVQYYCVPNFQTLGRKLRKDGPKVFNSLKALPSAEVKKFEQEGKITIQGYEVEAKDVEFSRDVDLSAGPSSQDRGDAEYKYDTDKDVIVLLDAQRRPQLEKEYVVRSFINRVQRLRKELRCKPTDDLDMWLSDFKVLGTEGGDVKEREKEFFEVTTEFGEMISKVVRRLPRRRAEKPEETGRTRGEKEVEIDDLAFTVMLTESDQ